MKKGQGEVSFVGQEWKRKWQGKEKWRGERWKREGEGRWTYRSISKVVQGICCQHTEPLLPSFVLESSFEQPSRLRGILQYCKRASLNESKKRREDKMKVRNDRR